MSQIMKSNSDRMDASRIPAEYVTLLSSTEVSTASLPAYLQCSSTEVSTASLPEYLQCSSYSGGSNSNNDSSSSNSNSNSSSSSSNRKGSITTATGGGNPNAQRGALPVIYETPVSILQGSGVPAVLKNLSGNR